MCKNDVRMYRTCLTESKTRSENSNSNTSKTNTAPSPAFQHLVLPPFGIRPWHLSPSRCSWSSLCRECLWPWLSMWVLSSIGHQPEIRLSQKRSASYFRWLRMLQVYAVFAIYIVLLTRTGNYLDLWVS